MGPAARGVHRIHVRTPDHRRASATLIAAPARVPQPAKHTHGFLVQLYSLLSARSWGMGDLGDLADLAAWAGRTLGSGFVQVNPLHAAVPGRPTDPSPYRPSSRRFPTRCTCGSSRSRSTGTSATGPRWTTSARTRPPSARPC
ncbi:hypothetical protein STENM327S_02344 [Streptomyces tendae]